MNPGTIPVLDMTINRLVASGNTSSPSDNALPVRRVSPHSGNIEMLPDIIIGNRIDGFVFLGHRIIRKRSRYGKMRVVTTISKGRARNFAASLTALLSGNYSESKVSMVELINRKLKGWSAFYQFVDFKAKMFSYIDRVVFWKLAYWLAHKYRKSIKQLMRMWCKTPKPGMNRTWILFGRANNGSLCGEILYRMVGQGKKSFRWRNPEGNPYLRTESRNTWTSRYAEVAMALDSI